MSSLVVPVAIIDEIQPHPNADALELAQVLGWQLVVKKDWYRPGDKVVYFPPDTILPWEVSERFEVTKYLSKQRIRCARLRGEPSFGLAVAPDDESWEVGANVADHYGASRYIPPLRPEVTDALPPHPLFPCYTEIENLRNFPHVLEEGELVLVTEKIHGTNCRIGLVEGEWMAGSHALRRERPADDSGLTASIYWFPYSLPEVRSLLTALQAECRQAILYGEVYGAKIQSLAYGQDNTGLGFRAFDLLLDGKYMSWGGFEALCAMHDVPTVPLVAQIPFTLAAIKGCSAGQTLIEGAGHIREGVVVRPAAERTHPDVGRVILKYLADEYLLSKQSDYQDR